MIVGGPMEVLFPFIRQRLDIAYSEDMMCIGNVKNGCLVAVAAYNGWTGKTCTFHGAIDDPAGIDRTYLRAIFDYPFAKCGLTHVLSPVVATNKRSLSFCVRSGFVLASRLHGAGKDGEDLLILQLAKSDCRWSTANGEKFKSAAAARLRGRGQGTVSPVERADSTADIC